MAHVSTLSKDQQEYLKNPRALEARCGVEPLENLLRTGSGLVGVSRLIIEPSFGPATLLTLHHGAVGVHMEVVRPKVNLWYAMEEGGPAWVEPAREEVQFKVGDMPELMQDFARL